MSALVVHPDTLRQLIANCRKSSKRFLGFPRDWCPHKVLNPNLPPGFYFTDESAWEYIAVHMETRPFQVIQLFNPAGKLALEMTATLPGVSRPLYMKVQIGDDTKAIGRSFHISEKY